MLGDLKSHWLIIAKGLLFLLAGALAGGLLLFDHPDLRSTLLLSLCVWCFCRFYYFAFYVVQHYVDENYRFSGLISLLQYFWQRRKPEID
jgi:hypothetical protein